MKEIIHCVKCKRPVLDHNIDTKTRIVYCYGCNYYFPDSKTTKRKRNEITIPNRTSYIRLRIEEDSLEVTIRWFGNYSLLQILGEIVTEDMRALASILGYFLNKTIIKTDRKLFRIDHKPIDVLPMTYYRSSYVKQLFVKSLDSTAMTYGLFAKLETGEEKMLIWNLNKQILLFVEQEIERVLGIEDIESENEIS